MQRSLITTYNGARTLSAQLAERRMAYKVRQPRELSETNIPFYYTV